MNSTVGIHVAGVDGFVAEGAGVEDWGRLNIVASQVDRVDRDEAVGGAGGKREGACLADTELPPMGARTVATVGVRDAKGSTGHRGDIREGG